MPNWLVYVFRRPKDVRPYKLGNVVTAENESEACEIGFAQNPEAGAIGVNPVEAVAVPDNLSNLS